MVDAPFLVVASAMCVLTERARVRVAYIPSNVCQTSADDVSVVTPMNTSLVNDEKRYPRTT
jgi:hypothetical protein